MAISLGNIPHFQTYPCGIRPYRHSAAFHMHHELLVQNGTNIKPLHWAKLGTQTPRKQGEGDGAEDWCLDTKLMNYHCFSVRICGFLRFSIHPHSQGPPVFASQLLFSSSDLSILPQFLFGKNTSFRAINFHFLGPVKGNSFWNRRFAIQKLVVSWRVPFISVIQMMKMMCFLQKSSIFAQWPDPLEVDGGRGQVPDTAEDLAARVWAPVLVIKQLEYHGISMVQWPGTGSYCPIEGKMGLSENRLNP